MIDTIARRRMTLNGKTYQKGAIVPMPEQQFRDLEPTGMVGLAPKPKAAPRSKPKAAVKRKPAPKPAPVTPEPKSDESSD